MGKSWWLTLADGKDISQMSRILNFLPTVPHLFCINSYYAFLLYNKCHLELHLKLFRILKKKIQESTREE